MKVRRPLGLQGWLVAAFLAVGVVASLAVLLVLLPTLESNVRQDRAKLESERLARALAETLGRFPVAEPLSDEALDALTQALRDATRADIRVTYMPGPGTGLFSGRVTRQIPTTDEATNHLDEAARWAGRGYSDDGRTLARNYRRTLRSGGVIDVLAAQTLSGIAPELAIVRQRVIVAMIVVLALATLMGILLAKLLGGRLRRLAQTAATLAGGDLGARTPMLGTVPAELVVLGDSLDGMAARLQSLVDAITDERDRDRAMIGSLAEGVLAVGPGGDVSVANDAAKRLLGLPEDAESARLEMLPPAIMDAVLAARAPDAPPVDHRQVVLPQGVELELHVARLGGEAGVGTVVTLRDVTEQRRLERARRDLVANVSHELKTPIAALKGFLELLESDRVDGSRRREFLTSMSQETERLERLVEEQLQLARLDAGALPLDLEDVDLGALVDEVVDARGPLARRAGRRLGSRHVGATPVVLADAARIEQVLLILLDNALRHTPVGGEVEVLVTQRGQDAMMAVRDTGEGIPAEDLPFIFDRFYRADPSREGRSAGLGLAIARGLVAAHRGGIDVESTVGTGTTFTVTLPLVSAGAVTQESAIPAALLPPPPPPPAPT